MPFAVSKVHPRWFLLLSLSLLTIITVIGISRYQHIHDRFEKASAENQAKALLLINMRSALMQRIGTLGEISDTQPGTQAIAQPDAYDDNAAKLANLLAQSAQTTLDEQKRLREIEATAKTTALVISKINDIAKTTQTAEAIWIMQQAARTDLPPTQAASIQARAKPLWDTKSDIEQLTESNLHNGAGKRWLAAVNDMISLETDMAANSFNAIGIQYVQLRNQTLMMCAGVVLLALMAMWRKTGRTVTTARA